MRKIKPIYLILILLIMFSGCKEQNNQTNVIQADIDKMDKVSIFDLFEKVEIIPLETTEQSLIGALAKVVCYKDIFYIHDFSEHKILTFDSIGKFLYNKIDDRGQGPEQYLYIADFDIDERENVIVVLASINNMLYEYDLSGKFLRKIVLPVFEQAAYAGLKCLNDNKIVFYTFDYNNRLKFYDKGTNQIYQECFPERKSMFSHFSQSTFPFGNYVAKATIDNNIYEVFPDGTYSIAYTWNFGQLDNNANIINKFPYRNFSSREEADAFAKQIRASEGVNYIFEFAGGNHAYRHAQIMRKNKRIQIWHRIADKKTVVFEKTTEGAIFLPLYWSDEFVIGLGQNADQWQETMPDTILDEANLAKKRQIKDDDNPVLVKYYFKK